MELIDRSPQGLIDALCKRIEKLLTPSFWYPDERNENEYRTPTVYAQLLPVSLTSSPERDKSKDYPIVQVACTSGIISDFSEVSNGSNITIQIHFGGHSKDTDNQGWRIPMAMLWRTLQDLLSNTICNGYQLDTPIKWSPLGKNEPPYYHAFIETVWTGCPPALEFPIEDKVLHGIENQN
ncbi:MAG: hypothetical protein FWB95_02565 [Treponema sp.]|nr:hypothetical protein [Treponema sp.]